MKKLKKAQNQKQNNEQSAESRKKRIAVISVLSFMVILAVVVLIYVLKMSSPFVSKLFHFQDSNNNITVSPTPATRNTAAPTSVNETVTPTISDTPVPSGASEPSQTTTPSLIPTISVTSAVITTPAPTNTPIPTIVPTVTPVPKKDTPFYKHGKLKVSGTCLVDASGAKFQLRGVSTHGLQWYPQYVNPDSFRMVRDEWNANVIRLALYTDENGYCTCSEAEKQKLKKIVKDGIHYATDLGLYVIVDWHILHDLTPMKYLEESKAFFQEICKEFAGYDNILYEICNEPNGGTGWEEIKRYAGEIIPVIRKYCPDSVIIVGTPTWSQDVDLAAANPIQGKNIMYALHFYAGTHKDNLRQKMVAAIKSGLPVFVSEFGITDASGNGRCDIDEANKWIVVLNENHISYVCWNLANKNESSCLIRQNVNKLSGLTEDELSTEALWLIYVLHDRLPVSEEDKEKILKDSEQGYSGGDVGAPAGIALNVNTNGYKISLVSQNTWMEGTKYCYQMDLNIRNTSGKSKNGWKLTVNFSSSVSCSDYWCCDLKSSGKSITLKPEDYNKMLGNGGEVSGIGFILKCDAPLKPESASLE